LEKTEPIPMKPLEEKALGITTKYGIKFDKDGQIMHQTKL
jgi:hypothetical protein